MSIFIFCYHSVITNGCQDSLPATAFLYCSLFFSTLLYIFRQQKNPGNLTVPGYLTFGHNVPCGTQYILISDYSMIVATRPDPTVRPPSRYQTGVLLCANGDFSCDLWIKIRIFRCVRVVFGDFVIMVLSPL